MSQIRSGRLGFLPCVLMVVALLAMSSWSQAGVVVIGDSALGPLDAKLIGRIYTGRTVQVHGQAVRPVNWKSGQPERSAFLQAVLQQSDDDYVAYWIVRRAIGKGTPPPELETAREIIGYVRATPGAVAYIDEAQLEPGLTVLLILP